MDGLGLCTGWISEPQTALFEHRIVEYNRQVRSGGRDDDLLFERVRDFDNDLLPKRSSAIRKAARIACSSAPRETWSTSPSSITTLGPTQ
jgi:hypothetical protein